MNAISRRGAALCVLPLLVLAAGCATEPAPAPSAPASSPSKPAASAAQPAQPAWSPALAAVFEAAQRAAQGRGVEITRTPANELLVRATGDAAFDSGRTTINARFRQFLDSVAEPLARVPGVKVHVVGHTDNVGSNAVNDRISLERATSAKDYLAAKGVAAERISAEGRGEREPVAGNDSAEGRASNRRVELLISQGAR
ncbi:OmpA family protein [Eleftheria terrae]|uniref:OmpA family protein n=1 Tax=Eleftheria terrae TaxID=1597781 RepID=UPI00263BD24E|nr:OmpA family protein [Eleftheria terrae]WKB51472.1 OmpA family protein [Eleftheria terrae]